MIKVTILALVYLSAPALVTPDDLLHAQSSTKKISVVYKSNDVIDVPVTADTTNVADEENCDEVLVDFEAPGDRDLQRYTMLRTE